jgi:hypothetical protein
MDKIAVPMAFVVLLACAIGQLTETGPLVRHILGDTISDQERYLHEPIGNKAATPALQTEGRR